MKRFFKKLFKRGDFMTRSDKVYYSRVFRTTLWSLFAFVIIAWVGTNLVLCALTTDVTSNFDIDYTAPQPAILPIGKEVNRIIRNRTTYTDAANTEDMKVKNIVFDKFTNKEVDVYEDANGNNLINGAEKVALNVDDEIYLYRASNGADIYILSNKDIYANQDSSYMFRGLSYGPMYGNPEGVSITFNNFHTDYVENMSYMFAGGIYGMEGGSRQGFIELDLSGWNTSNVTDMSYMFDYCSCLTTLNLSGWDTKNVTTMSNMFTLNIEYYSGYYTLDLSSFDTRSVRDMSMMFYHYGDFQSGLQTIYASDRFVVDQVEKSDFMFGVCGNLVGGQGTKCSGNSIYSGSDETTDKTCARIDGKDGLPGYFTEKPYSGK